MFTKRTTETTDEFHFLRERAAELLDEGKVEQAMEMLQVIDKEQLRLLKPLLKEAYRAAP
ncbi:MAG: hypothetical protein GXY67_05555 [Clostridiales bacterium]|nr:hypothetical protein [Clostridiales bacterium]